MSYGPPGTYHPTTVRLSAIGGVWTAIAVGHAGGSLGSAMSPCTDETVCLIDPMAIGVRPEWRERGIGSALMMEALRRFQAAGGDYAMLDVHVDNPRAARVYTRLGFERVGRRGRYVRVLT